MLEYSSLLFLINVVYAYFQKAYAYSIILLGLTITSYLLHTSDKKDIYNSPLFWFDQIMILILLCTYVYYTIFLPFNAQIVSFLALGLVTMLYYGGYVTESCCFDSCKERAVFSHTCMHIIGAIGNHFVIALI